MADSESSIDALRASVELACQPQNAHRIVAGREQVLAMPRAWVLANIEQVAAEVLDWSDDWEYRRLLELASLLDAQLTQRLVGPRLTSTNPDIREAAEAFQDLRSPGDSAG